MFRNVGIITGFLLLTVLLFGGESGTKGTMKIDNYGNGIQSVSAQWDIGSLMGEVTLNTHYLWVSAGRKRLPSDTALLLKVADPSGRYAYYVKDSGGTVPEPGESSFNPTGSPDLGQLFYTDRSCRNFLSKRDAGIFWKQGFKVVSFELVFTEDKESQNIDAKRNNESGKKSGNVQVGDETSDGGIVIAINGNTVVEVGPTDLGRMSFGDAVVACKNYRLGGWNNWRLPNNNELVAMYKLHKKGIGSFTDDFYWEGGSGTFELYAKLFSNGLDTKMVSSPDIKYFARPVRTYQLNK